MYDAQGRPAMWLPSSSLAVVNVSYSTTGQLVGLQRGSMSEKTEFDSQGRILSRSFVDGKVWSYSYLDKVSTSIFNKVTEELGFPKEGNSSSNLN